MPKKQVRKRVPALTPKKLSESEQTKPSNGNRLVKKLMFPLTY